MVRVLEGSYKIDVNKIKRDLIAHINTTECKYMHYSVKVKQDKGIIFIELMVIDNYRKIDQLENAIIGFKIDMFKFHKIINRQCETDEYNANVDDCKETFVFEPIG